MNAVMLCCMIAIVLCCVNAVVLCCMNAVAALKSPEQLSVSNKGIQRIQGPRHMNVLKNTKGQRQSVGALSKGANWQDLSGEKGSSGRHT